MNSLKMEIDHIHFYVEDATSQRDWFIKKLGCRHLSSVSNSHTHTEVLKNGPVYFVLSSPLDTASAVFDYLKVHPPGVVDIALKIGNIESFLTKIPFSPEIYHCSSGTLKWLKVAGWGSLMHTLIENSSAIPFCDLIFGKISPHRSQTSGVDPLAPRCSDAKTNPWLTFSGIDHVVLNVPAGALKQAVNWYINLFGLQVQQAFNIQTERSGLNSQVLASPDRQFYFNINEPTSANSQIQEFLNLNQGSGIQHIALRTPNIVQTVKRLRQRGQSFLSVPRAYYAQLKARMQHKGRILLEDEEFQAIQMQQILMDWRPQTPASLLLQIFTQPIFKEPTFFLS